MNLKQLAKYFFEIIAIFIGISISFIAEDYRESLKQNDDEEKIINEIKVNILDDYGDIGFDLDYTKSQIQSIDSLLNILESGTYNPVFDTLVAMSIYEYNFTPREQIYQDLVQRGISLVKNKKIKYRLAYIYDDEYERYQRVIDTDYLRIRNELIQYLLTTFKTVRGMDYPNYDKLPEKGNRHTRWRNTSMPPINFNKLLTDENLKTLYRSYKESLKEKIWNLMILRRSIADVNELIEDEFDLKP